MKKILYSSILFLAIFVAIFFFSSKKEESFREKMLHLIRECVHYNDQIAKKEEVDALIDHLITNPFILEQGSDNLRIKYVNFQGCLEHVLACSQALKETVSLIGMIHAPLPATPLCTKPDDIDSTLLDASIRYDLDKLLTVRSRAHTVREYLTKGGKLFVVYPQGGLEKRSVIQQNIYRDELQKYQDRLIDWVLNADTIDPDMIGATYFFKDNRNKIYVFSIKSKQANDPQENSEWGLWFGEIKNSEIKKRITEIFTYFKTCNGPTKKEFHV